MYVGWGFLAAGPLLHILLAELRAFYVGALRLSSRRAPAAHTYCRVKGFQLGFPSAGPICPY